MDSFAEKNNFRQNRELSTYLYERPYNFLKEDTPATLVHRPEKFIAISILREDFYRLHFLGSSYISRRREEKTWRGGGVIRIKKTIETTWIVCPTKSNGDFSIFFFLINGWIFLHPRYKTERRCSNLETLPIFV